MVAIDGPAGAGKSTLARALAAELSLPYVNTGSMYRALAREAQARGIDPNDEPRLSEVLRGMAFDVDRGVHPPSLLVNGEAPGADLATPEVERTVSAVARHPRVRRLMAAEQRRLGREGAVMEGRDIGTVVFPAAEVKIFLSAEAGERAVRRTRERRGQAGLARALARRDARDARVNPFVPAPDAVVIDTTGRSQEEVLEAALRVVRARLRP